MAVNLGRAQQAPTVKHVQLARTETMTSIYPLKNFKLRATIWVVAAVFVVLAGSVAGLMGSQTPDAIPTAAPMVPMSPSAADIPESIESRYSGSDAVNLLPAYRWDDVTLSAIGESGFNPVQNVSNSAASSIASLLYAFQALLWGWLVELLGFAFDTSWLAESSVAANINAAFLTVSSVVIGSGLIFLPLILAAFAAARAAMQGRTQDIGRVLVTALIPLGTLWMFHDQALRVEDNVEAVKEKAGPVGFAAKTTDRIQEAAGLFGSGFGAMNGMGGMDEPSALAERSPSCGAYMETLYSSYAALTSSDGSNSGAAMLPRVSSLWERTFLDGWRKAQYGDTPGSWSIYCHHLEASTAISRAEQVTLGVMSGYPSIDSDDIQDILKRSDVHDDGVDGASSSSGIFAPGAMELNKDGLPKSFGSEDSEAAGYFNDRGLRRDPYSASSRDDNSKDWQASLLMWSACRTSGDGDKTMWATEGWRFSGGVDGHHCEVWWNTGLNPGEGGRGPLDTPDSPDRAPNPGDKKLVFDGKPTEGSVAGSASDFDSEGTLVLDYDASIDDDVNDVRQLVFSMRGGNVGDRFWYGMISLITTLGYIYLLGGLAVGTLGAKLVLGLLIVLLPFTLTLLAMNQSGKGGSSAGKRMFRLTLSMLVASAVLSLTLTFLVFLTDTVESLLGSAGNGLLGAFVPMMAMFVLYWMLKVAGIANVFSPLQLATAPMAMGAWGAASGGLNSRKYAAQKTQLQARNGARAVRDSGKANAARLKRFGQYVKKDPFDQKLGMAGGAQAATSAGSSSSVSVKVFGAAASAASFLAGNGGRRKKTDDPRLQGANGAGFGTMSQVERSTLPGAKGTLAERLDDLRGAHQQLRDQNGNLLYHDGEPVFSFYKRDKDGLAVEASLEEAWDRKSGSLKEGYFASSTPFGTAEVDTKGLVAMSAGQISSEDIMLSGIGLAPLVATAPGQPKDEIRQAHPMHYVSDEVKEYVTDVAVRSGHAEADVWHAISVDPDIRWTDSTSGRTIDMVGPDAEAFKSQLAALEPIDLTAAVASMTVEKPFVSVKPSETGDYERALGELSDNLKNIYVADGNMLNKFKSEPGQIDEESRERLADSCKELLEIDAGIRAMETNSNIEDLAEDIASIERLIEDMREGVESATEEVLEQALNIGNGALSTGSKTWKIGSARGLIRSRLKRKG